MNTTYIKPVDGFVKLIALADSKLLDTLPVSARDKPVHVYYDIGDEPSATEDVLSMYVSSSHIPDSLPTICARLDIASVVEIELLCWDRCDADDRGEDDDNEDSVVSIPVDRVIGFVAPDGSVWIATETDGRAGEFYDSWD